MEFIVIYADREQIDPDQPVHVLQGMKMVLGSHQHSHRLKEMLHIVVGVKTDQVCPHNTM